MQSSESKNEITNQEDQVSSPSHICSSPAYKQLQGFTEAEILMKIGAFVERPFGVQVVPKYLREGFKIC